MIKRKKIIIISIAVAVVIIVGGVVGYSAMGENKTIAKVGTYTIKQKDLNEQLKNVTNTIKSQNPDISDVELKSQIESFTPQIKEQLIDNKIFEIQAEKLNILPNKDEMAKQVKTELDSIKENLGGETNYTAYLKNNKISEDSLKEELKQQIITSAIYNHIFKDIKVTDEEVKTYYDENTADYIKKSGATVAHVAASSQEEIDKIKKEIDGGLTFEEAAKKYNEDGTETNSGIIGYIEYSNEQMLSEENMKVLKSLKENEISSPVKEGELYHIFKVTGVVTEDKQLSFEESKETVKVKIENDKKMEIYNKAMETWKKELNVE